MRAFLTRSLTAVTLFVALAVPAAAPAAAGAADALPTPTLGLAAAPTQVRFGERVRLTATVGVPGATLSLSRLRAGESDYVPLATATADAAGKVVWVRTPQVATTYRADFAGDTIWGPARAEAAVAVAPRITLTVRQRRAVFEKDGVKLRVRVAPAHPGASVMLRQWDAAASSWTDLGALTLDADSRATTAWSSDTAGSYRLRVRMAADTQHVTGLSPVLRLRVLDPSNPYGVPARIPRLILVDRSKYKLFYHERGRVVRVFDCVLGRPGLPTPLGHFRIYAKDAGIGGPYGPRRMRYLGAYAIHGTNEPWLLKRYPRNFSHGCTRLSNSQILWLYARCRVGTPVWNVR